VCVCVCMFSQAVSLSASFFKLPHDLCNPQTNTSLLQLVHRFIHRQIMSTSPFTHSQTSLSNSQQHEEASLDVLVRHLLSSKRSLESINKVWRANEIVTAARAALEESVVLQARTAFLRKGISQQVKILRKVRNELEYVYMEGDKDFRVYTYLYINPSIN